MSDNDRRQLAADYIASLTDNELNQFIEDSRGVTAKRQLLREALGKLKEEQRAFGGFTNHTQQEN